MGNDNITGKDTPLNEIEASDKILTLANLITLIRLLLVPISFTLLINGQDIEAAALFALTAATDFLDGLVARKTNSVTKLGQLLDPLVDRVLIVSVIIGLLIIGRLPAWIVIFAIVRDAYLIIGGVWLVKGRSIRIPVSYVGKVSMWFLCIGFAGLVLNMPIIAGFGLCDFSWLPGFSSDMYCPFIWSVYIGIAMSFAATIIYTVRAVKALKNEKQ